MIFTNEFVVGPVWKGNVFGSDKPLPIISILITAFTALALIFLANSYEPLSPNSSPANATNKIVRSLIACYAKYFAKSTNAVVPEALSLAPLYIESPGSFNAVDGNPAEGFVAAVPTWS